VIDKIDEPLSRIQNNYRYSEVSFIKYNIEPESKAPRIQSRAY